MAITDKKTGPWGLDQVYNKINQGSIWNYSNTANLYTWGRNEHGQLGVNQSPSDERSSPVQVPGSWSTNDGMTLSGRKVSARDFVLNIKSDGTLWGWGLNNKGQLGVNSVVKYSSPIQIGSDTNWAALGDFNHYAVSTATKTDGTLWVWGDGDSKQQYGAVQDRSSPTQVPGTTWSASFTGSNHAGALTTTGELWSWGYNDNGQLGQNDRTDSLLPLQIPGTTWSSAVGGNKCNYAIKTDGTLWVWGENDYGQLGMNAPENSDYSSPVQVPGTTWTEKISANGSTTIAVKTDGTLWGWGRNTAGNLGLNNTTDYSSPTQVPGSTWDKVAIGNYYQSFAIKTDGTFWSWGNNRHGSLGQNSHSPGPGNSGISSPTQIPGTWDTVIGAGTDNGGIALKSA
jgi:alpha-tubulin suppressor-like RCC1 family protein